MISPVGMKSSPFHAYGFLFCLFIELFLEHSPGFGAFVIQSWYNKNMKMEGFPNQKPKKEVPQRLWLANEAGLKFAVGKIKVTGKENFKEIPPGMKVVVMTTHLTDLDVPLAVHAVARDLDISIMNMSTHHKFWGEQGEASTNIGMHIAGKQNFIPIDYQRDKSGEKSPSSFNPKNFESAKKILDEGKSVVIAAHNPSREVLHNLEGVKGGYGGVYLAEIADAYILPVTVSLDRAAGMYRDTMKTVKERPNASVQIGKPFKLPKIADIERFSELMQKREGGNKLNEKEHAEFSMLADALRERSQEVIRLMSDQLTRQG